MYNNTVNLPPLLPLFYTPEIWIREKYFVTLHRNNKKLISTYTMTERNIPFCRFGCQFIQLYKDVELHTAGREFLLSLR